MIIACWFPKTLRLHLKLSPNSHTDLIFIPEQDWNPCSKYQHWVFRRQKFKVTSWLKVTS